ncbi:MAG: sigma-70 family RNA polymerase sigma factor [Sulfuriflexus sp.]|nr:sigma-70 family RNA polymerase sigma factor [Sulfuriflexus sp.]
MFDPVALIKSFCRNNDQTAFQGFYRSQSNKLWGFLCARGANTELAYDLLAEAFLKFSQSICKDPRAPVAFLYRIAINLHIDNYRRQQARPEDSNTELTEASADSAMPIDEREWLRRLIKKLPQNEQNLLLMRYWIGLTHREIAESIKLPEGTVRRQAAASLKKLRQYWQENQ